MLSVKLDMSSVTSVVSFDDLATSGVICDFKFEETVFFESKLCNM